MAIMAAGLTVACLLYGALYLVTNRIFALKIACVFLFVAILIWIPVALVVLGIMPQPVAPPR
jgi:hypothetical protein